MTRMDSSLLRFRSAIQRDCDTQSQDPLRLGSVEGRQAAPKKKPEAKIIEAPLLHVIVSPPAYDFAPRIRLVIGDKLKALRAQKYLSQGDIKKRTGLLRCYISRIENGHTVPFVDTLEKVARALEVPMYRFFTSAVRLVPVRYRRWSLACPRGLFDLKFDILICRRRHRRSACFQNQP